MKTRTPLVGSLLKPRERQIVQTAYDGAWEILKPRVGVDTIAKESARLQLADAFLHLEVLGPLEVLHVLRLRDQAILRYHVREAAMTGLFRLRAPTRH